MNIRLEAPRDIEGIREILRAAFAGEQEADLVDGLRHDGDLLLSMVAESSEQLIGHIGFSRLWIQRADHRVPGVSLAPLSVAEDHRRRGIGAALVETGHACLRTTGEAIVFVLGDPGRFDYSIAAAAGFDCVYAGPHFQALPLANHAPKAGVINYAAAFGRLQ